MTDNTTQLGTVLDEAISRKVDAAVQEALVGAFSSEVFLRGVLRELASVILRATGDRLPVASGPAEPKTSAGLRRRRAIRARQESGESIVAGVDRILRENFPKLMTSGEVKDALHAPRLDAVRVALNRGKNKNRYERLENADGVVTWRFNTPRAREGTA